MEAYEPVSWYTEGTQERFNFLTVVVDENTVGNKGGHSPRLHEHRL